MMSSRGQRRQQAALGKAYNAPPMPGHARLQLLSQPGMPCTHGGGSGEDSGGGGGKAMNSGVQSVCLSSSPDRTDGWALQVRYLD